MLGALEPEAVVSWLGLVAFVVAAWLIWRGGGSTAISTLETANRVLERRVRELEQQARIDEAKIDELTGATDVVRALEPLLEWTARHEERAQTRHEATVSVLGLIADRLGPDPNGTLDSQA